MGAARRDEVVSLVARSLCFLDRFQRQIDAPHAFQAVVEMPYVDADPFSRHDPCVVPASTLLSMLP